LGGDGLIVTASNGDGLRRSGAWNHSWLCADSAEREEGDAQMHDISAMPRGKRLSATQGRRRLAVVVVTCVVALTLLVAGTAAGHSQRALKAGGTLTIATSAAPSTLDPASGQNSYSPYYDLAYDPLIIKSPDGSYKPGLALSWRYGPRNKSFSLKLRPGVRFSDGTRLTANVVKTWVEHAKTLPGGYGSTYFSALTDVKITGSLSLTLLFNTPTCLRCWFSV